MRKAFLGMRHRRATGPSGVAAEMSKAAEGVEVEDMTAPLRIVAKEKKIPDHLAGSTTIALYKGKGDVLDHTKYRGLQLLEHGVKTLEKVFDTKLRSVLKISGQRSPFVLQSSSLDSSKTNTWRENEACICVCRF